MDFLANCRPAPFWSGNRFCQILPVRILLSLLSTNSFSTTADVQNDFYPDGGICNFVLVTEPLSFSRRNDLVLVLDLQAGVYVWLSSIDQSPGFFCKAHFPCRLFDLKPNARSLAVGINQRQVSGSTGNRFGNTAALARLGLTCGADCHVDTNLDSLLALPGQTDEMNRPCPCPCQASTMTLSPCEV